MAYVFLPLVFAFELGFHFERFFSRGGQLLPALGRQFEFGWDAFGVGMGPWLIKIFQILLLFIGVFASQTVLERLIRTHRQEPTPHHLSRWQYWPIWLLAVVYMGLFGAG